MKIANYNDRDYIVPDWANYIAADGNGNIYAYAREPEWESNAWVPDRGSKFEYISCIQTPTELKEIK